ncbi:MAG: protein kinase [Chloroflexota bacterium]
MNNLPEEHYHNLELLEEAAFAKINKAQHKSSRGYVAVKRWYGSDEDQRDYFNQEVATLESLQFPPLGQVSRTNDSARTPSITYQYVEGKRLDVLLKERGKPLTPPESISIALAVLEALKPFHQKSIFDLKIKPSNLVITPQDTLKILDFRIDRPRLDQANFASGVLDTIYYESVEEAKGELPVESSNLYSLGIVLYEMLSGKPPFIAPTTFGLKQMHLQQKPANLPNLDLDHLIQKALSKEPAGRYPHIVEMSAALDSYLAKNGAGVLPLNRIVNPTSQPTLPPPPPPSPPDMGKLLRQPTRMNEKRPLVLVGIIAMVLILFTVIGFSLLIISKVTNTEVTNTDKTPTSMAVVVTTVPPPVPTTQTATAGLTAATQAPTTTTPPTPVPTTLAPSGTPVSELFDQIGTAIDQNNWEEAVKLTNSLKENSNLTEPEKAKASSLAAQVYCTYGKEQAHKDYTTGINYLDKCILEDPSPENKALNQALLEKTKQHKDAAALANDKKWAEAIAQLKTLYEQDKSFTNTRDILVDAYLQYASALKTSDKTQAQDLVCNKAKSIEELTDEQKGTIDTRCKEVSPTNTPQPPKPATKTQPTSVPPSATPRPTDTPTQSPVPTKTVTRLPTVGTCKPTGRDYRIPCLPS